MQSSMPWPVTDMTGRCAHCGDSAHDGAVDVAPFVTVSEDAVGGDGGFDPDVGRAGLRNSGPGRAMATATGCTAASRMAHAAGEGPTTAMASVAVESSTGCATDATAWRAAKAGVVAAGHPAGGAVSSVRPLPRRTAWMWSGDLRTTVSGGAVVCAHVAVMTVTAPSVRTGPWNASQPVHQASTARAVEDIPLRGYPDFFAGWSGFTSAPLEFASRSSLNSGLGPRRRGQCVAS